MGRGGEGSGGVGRAWVGGATRSSVISHPEIPFAPAGRDRAREVFRGGAAETPVCVYIALVVCTVGQSTAFSTRANLPGERLFFIYASRFHQKNAVQVAQNAPHAPSPPPFSAPSRSLAPPVKTAACHRPPGSVSWADGATRVVSVPPRLHPSLHHLEIGDPPPPCLTSPPPTHPGASSPAVPWW